MRALLLLALLLTLPAAKSMADEPDGGGGRRYLPQPSLYLWVEPESAGPLAAYWQIDLGLDVEGVLLERDWLRFGPFLSTNAGSDCRSCYWDLGVWSEYSLPLTSEVDWLLDFSAWQTDYARSSDWRSEQYGLVSTGLGLSPTRLPGWNFQFRYEHELVLRSPEPLPSDSRFLLIFEWQH